MHDHPGEPLEEVLNKNVVFELDFFSYEHRSLFLSGLTRWLLTYRIDNHLRSSLHQELIFDEAHLVLSADKVKVNSSMANLITQAREFGIGIASTSQMPSAISEVVKANVFTQISFGLSSTRDITATAYAMGLSTEQKDFLTTLPVGTAIVRLATRWTKPFLLHVPMVDVDKNISDAEVEHHMGESPRSESDYEYTTSQSKKTSTVSPQLSASKDSSVSNEAIRLVENIRDYPFVPVSKRIKSLGLSVRKANAILNELVAKELLKEVSIPQGVGRPAKLFQFTDALEAQFGKQKTGKGKGSFTHKYYQRAIAEHNRSLGYKAEIECFRNGKLADVGIEKPNESIAIEVSLTHVHVVENIQKDLNAGWDKVIIGFADNSVKRLAKRDVKDQLDKQTIKNHVQFVPLAKLMGN